MSIKNGKGIKWNFIQNIFFQVNTFKNAAYKSQPFCSAVNVLTRWGLTPQKVIPRKLQQYIDEKILKNAICETTETILHNMILIHCGLMMSHDNIGLGQDWFKQCLCDIRQQAITWTNVTKSHTPYSIIRGQWMKTTNNYWQQMFITFQAFCCNQTSTLARTKKQV